MKKNLTRRDFVGKSAWGAAASMTLPAFLHNTLFQLDARAQSLPPQGSEGPILLIMEMAGGNDSLNTVIPFANEIYTGARPSIKLSLENGIHQIGQAESVTGSNENLALHPNLTDFHNLWQDGELGIVNGVGYPNPNLSHFTSFDFWQSAEPNSVPRSGWIGRYFDSQCNGCGATSGIEIAGLPTLAFKSGGGISPTISFDDVDSYAWQDQSVPGRESTMEELYRTLIGLDHPVDNGIASNDDALAYVQRAAHNAMISTSNVRQANANAGNLLYGSWPNSNLANDLKLIAQLIKGGSETSIYYAHQGGYDTHNDQINSGNPVSGRHFSLMREINDALFAFSQEMKLQGQWDRVMVMTFSEFGRKVIENGSLGTDHGAAESLFFMGGQVNGGQFYGQFPDLAEEARVKRDSLDFNIDFRTVYRSVLENWMHVPASAMGDIFPSQPTNFNPLPIA